MDSAHQWKSVNGDDTLQTFRTMYLENQLLCSECYGMNKITCTSSDPACDEGLMDLSMSGNQSRWDQALGVFAQSQSDLDCDIEDSSQCSEAPQCSSDHGPAGLALLKSMTTMHNSLSNIYMAIDRAHEFASDQMQLFAEVFAPVPSLKNKAIFTEIMFLVAGLIAGAALLATPFVLPMVGLALGIGGLAVDLGLGVGSAFVMNDMIFDQPSAPDTSTVLAAIVSNIQEVYSSLAASLFANGSYTYSAGEGSQNTISWTTLMEDGSLLQQQDNTTDGLEATYERILYQQMAIYTWYNLETGSAGHVPFITFVNGPCDQISPLKNSSLEHVIGGVGKSDTNLTYNGICYYLLDGTTHKDFLGHHSCVGKALPGGTNKEMTGNADEFQQLSLADFIIPSVKGWQAHDQQNGYQSAAASNQIYTSTQAAGAVSLPLCDYVGKPDSPGVGCPTFGKSNGSSCYTFDVSTGINQPGDFVEGRCGVHVEQWQKNNGGENQLDTYELLVNILDNDRRLIGSATKQSAAETLEIVDSVLPYDLYVATGNSDLAPIRFWYADQYWDSNSQGNGSHQCSVGAYDSGARQMDCGFACNKPDSSEDPPASATIANPFPNTPIAAIGGATTFSNIYITATPTFGNVSLATPTPDYATGWCGVHIRQYQKNQGKGSDNDTPNYEIQVTFKGSDGKPIAGPDALLPAPSGTPVTITGMVKPFTVTAGAKDSDPLAMSYGGQSWDSNDKTHCGSVSKYKSGHRDMDCGFTC